MRISDLIARHENKVFALAVLGFFSFQKKQSEFTQTPSYLPKLNSLVQTCLAGYVFQKAAISAQRDWTVSPLQAGWIAGKTYLAFHFINQSLQNTRLKDWFECKMMNFLDQNVREIALRIVWISSMILCRLTKGQVGLDIVLELSCSYVHSIIESMPWNLKNKQICQLGVDCLKMIALPFPFAWKTWGIVSVLAQNDVVQKKLNLMFGGTDYEKMYQEQLPDECISSVVGLINIVQANFEKFGIHLGHCSKGWDEIDGDLESAKPLRRALEDFRDTIFKQNVEKNCMHSLHTKKSLNYGAFIPCPKGQHPPLKRTTDAGYYINWKLIQAELVDTYHRGLWRVQFQDSRATQEEAQEQGQASTVTQEEAQELNLKIDTNLINLFLADWFDTVFKQKVPVTKEFLLSLPNLNKWIVCLVLLGVIRLKETSPLID